MKRAHRMSADEAVAKMMRFVYDEEDDSDDDSGPDNNDLQDLNGEIEGIQNFTIVIIKIIFIVSINYFEITSFIVMININK